MKCKAIRALQLVLGLILFSAGGTHDSCPRPEIEQIELVVGSNADDDVNGVVTAHRVVAGRESA